ncbi:MAG: hypothetical protein IJ532_04270 [Alphaproteobacteria bacterium]|nr:hypothetical protein [Alphaproteobacteria bacterium]
MKEHNNQNNKHSETSSYSMENMENSSAHEENSGVWEATKEGVAKAWSATKEGASKAWDKTKDVTEDITGFGHHDRDEEAYFEDESIIDNHGYSLHHSQGFSENDEDFAAFSETDGNIPHTHKSNHLHSSSSHIRR